MATESITKLTVHRVEDLFNEHTLTIGIILASVTILFIGGTYACIMNRVSR